MTESLVFRFNGKPVGYFETPEYPSVPGRYRYMPFRGVGHYEMHQELRANGRALCYFNEGGSRVSFEVAGAPEEGVLDLRDFTRSDSTEG